MRLNEFTKPQSYKLPADDVDSFLQQLERVWRDLLRMTHRTKNGRKKLLDAV